MSPIGCHFHNCQRTLLTMYEELVKRLRWAASYDERIVIQDAKDAADTIEELQRQKDEWESHATVAEIMATNQWISVTERLPKYNEIVLISNGKSVGDGFLEHRHNIIGEEYDRWFTHFSDIEEEEVNWWMPLPKPPKENIK